jgi:DNA replication protein DnaC
MSEPPTTNQLPATTAARTQSEAETYQRLRAHLAFLNLADAAAALPGLLDQARVSKLPLVETLEALLAVEVTATEERRLTSRLRFACLPAPWRLADFDFSAQPGIDEALIRELATLRFIDEGANVLLIGPPGVGKTMLAVGLARAGAEAGYRVYFTTAADLAARCRKAAIEGRWASQMRFYAGPRLLAIDELGYLPLPTDAAAALFQVINTRYANGYSTLITTNLGIGSWATAFGDDPIVAAAMLDRLLHRGVVVGIDGPSYRLRSHQARAETLRTGTEVTPHAGR